VSTVQRATKQSQTRDRVVDLIEQLGVGAAIPSERRLSTELGVSRLTLRAALDDLVRRSPLTSRADRPARKELPRHVARAARRLDRAVATVVDPTIEPAERDVAVHEARKAGKRLRYATEVALPVVGKDAKRFAKAMKGFQTALGEHQDTVVARRALRELGGQNGFAFGVLYGRDAARAARIEEELPGLWATAWTRRHRRWLR
jgi:CHAD domain-containing protein